MSDQPSYDELARTVEQLRQALFQKDRAEAVNKTLFHIASALNTSESLQDLYISIHMHLSALMDMSNFFIAIHYREKNAVQYVFRRDKEEQSLPRWVHRFSEKPSLTREVVTGKKPLFLEEGQLADLASRGGVLGRVPRVWLGVPLMIQDKVLGVMGVKSYTNPGQFSRSDMELLNFVSEQIAVSIERKRAENELRQARKRLVRTQKLEAIGTLAGGIAHDFNNTLSIILGNINLAQMVSNSDPLSEYLADAEASVLQAKALASKFVVFSRGRVSVKSPIEIQGFLEEVLSRLKKSRGVNYTLAIKDLPPVMEADKAQLKQALENIVMNGAEAGDMKGEVKISAGIHPSRQGMVLICVTDRGRGMGSQALEKIFDPYYSTKPMGQSKGTGLGLSLAWAIVKNHQGSIHIDSAPGQGTRVEIILPVFQKAGAREKGAPLPEKVYPKEGVSQKPMVLFMDDDPNILRVTGKILTRLGYEPVLAGSGEAAVERYNSLLMSGRIIQLAVLDLEVRQGMGGLETMEALLEINPGVKGILASGYGDDPAMKAHGEFGFSASLAKPFSIETLKQVLQNLL